MNVTSIDRVRLEGGPLANQPILQPGGALALYRVSPEQYDARLPRWPASAHYYPTPPSLYPRSGWLLVHDSMREQVEEAGGAAEPGEELVLLGRYLPRPANESHGVLSWDPAITLDTPAFSELHARLQELAAREDYRSVLASIEQMLPRLSPDTYTSLLPIAIDAARRLNRSDEALQLARRVYRIEPGLPSIQAFFS